MRIARPVVRRSAPLSRCLRSALLGIGLSIGLVASPATLAGTYVGAIAREIEVEDVVNARSLSPQEATIAAQSGRTIVLAFFSTNCESCPKVVPHLNRLSEAFEGEPVTIWTINHEGREPLERFLTEYDLAPPILVDSDFSVQRDYFIGGVPMMVLINPEGVVAAKVHPLEVDEEDIRVVMAGRTPEVPLSPDPAGLLPQGRPEQMAIAEAIVRPATQSRQPAFSRAGGLRFNATPLREILGAAWSVPGPLVFAEDLLLDAKYDVSVIPPRGKESEAVERLRALLEESFNIDVVKDLRDVDVLVLTAPEGPGPVMTRPARPRTQMQVRRGVLRARNATMAQVAYQLAEALGRPVIDETGLEDRFDLDVLWRPGDRDDLMRALREQMGVQIERETRELESLQVTRTIEPPGEEQG